MTQELNNQMALHWKLLKQIYELNKRKAFYKESRDRYNTKSFFELPHEEELQEAFKNQVRSNTDTLKVIVLTEYQSLKVSVFDLTWFLNAS